MHSDNSSLSVTPWDSVATALTIFFLPNRTDHRFGDRKIAYSACAVYITGCAGRSEEVGGATSLIIPTNCHLAVITE